MDSMENNSRRRWLAVVGAGLGGFAVAARAAPQSATQWPPITEFPSGRWTPGRWVWADLLTDDVEASRRFYGAVFDWTFDATDALDGRYVLVRAGDEMVAGLVVRSAIPSDERGGRWVPFMSAANPGRVAQAAVGAGGRVIVAPVTLPGRGEIAVLADREGTTFGVIRALGGEPDDYLAEPNEWVWLELWAHDADRAAEFYRHLGGYVVERITDEADSPHLQLVSAGHGRASVRPTPFPKLPSAWIPCVRVTDASAAAARVRGAGGRIAVAPRPDLLDGRVGVFADPGGAPFGVLAPAGSAS